jgi:hypothetical protein
VEPEASSGNALSARHKRRRTIVPQQLSETLTETITVGFLSSLIPLTDSSLMALTLSSHLFSASVFPLLLPFPLPILQVFTFLSLLFELLFCYLFLKNYEILLLIGYCVFEL